MKKVIFNNNNNMTKDLSFTEEELKDGENNEGGGSYAPQYGIFKGVIESVELMKDSAGGTKLKYKSGKPYYNLKINVNYVDNANKDKKRACFLHVGPYSNWMDLNKRFRRATGLTKEDLLNLDKYKNKDVGIKIGANKAYAGYSGAKETFEGYFVGEYEGKRFISNGIIDFVKYREVTEDKAFMGEEKSLRERFKKSVSSGGTQAGFDKEEATEEDLEF